MSDRGWRKHRLWRLGGKRGEGSFMADHAGGRVTPLTSWAEVSFHVAPV